MALFSSAFGEGEKTLLLGFVWLWTGVSTTSNTLRRSRLYLERLSGADVVRVLRYIYRQRDRDVASLHSNFCNFTFKIISNLDF